MAIVAQDKVTVLTGNKAAAVRALRAPTNGMVAIKAHSLHQHLFTLLRPAGPHIHDLPAGFVQRLLEKDSGAPLDLDADGVAGMRLIAAIEPGASPVLDAKEDPFCMREALALLAIRLLGVTSLMDAGFFRTEMDTAMTEDVVGSAEAFAACRRAHELLAQDAQKGTDASST